MAGSAAKRRTQGNVRKKTYYSLNTAGAEIRLPAFPNLRGGWKTASGALSLILLACIWAMWSAPTFQVDTIKVNGVQRIPAAEINTALDLEGISILEVMPDQVKQDLLAAFPDIATASVQVGLPAGVLVRVKEREPVMAWQQNGETRWIDKDGFIFPARGDSSSLMNVQSEGDPPAPADPEEKKPAEDAVVTIADIKPKAAGPYIQPALIAAIQKLSGQAPTGTSILYDPRYGLGWNDPKGWQVYFGTQIDNMDLKLNQYAVIIDDFSKRGIQPVMISVEFPLAPFYRTEP
jgi:cell division protein FtsQ